MRVYYFGAWGEPGLYVWTPGMRRPWPEKVGPWTVVDLDRPSYRDRYGRLEDTGVGFCPPDPKERQGVWRLTVGRDGAGAAWTALGCYDRTEDRRGGCKSVFVAEGEHTEDEMKRIAAQHFPEVWARIERGAPK